MIRKKIGSVAFECNEQEGTARIIQGQKVTEYKNAVEAWVRFAEIALDPHEREVRDALEANGFNRWTGTRKLDFTESEMKALDDRLARQGLAEYGGNI